MSDSEDEAACMLEDESMDEAHDLDDDLQASVDTNASPTKTAQRSVSDSDDNGDDDSDSSDDSALGRIHSESDDDEVDYGGGHGEGGGEGTVPRRGQASQPALEAARDHSDIDGDSDSDGPPEIPGSPLRSDSPDGRVTTNGDQMQRLEPTAASRGGSQHHDEQSTRLTADLLTIQHGASIGDDEYETCEVEQPRAMEFHASSSSDSEDRDSKADSDDDSDGRSGAKQHTRKLNSRRGGRGKSNDRQRPSTSVPTDLEDYRDLVPKAYYDQKVQEAERSELSDQALISQGHRDDMSPSSESPRRAETMALVSSATSCRIKVPHEIQELFHYVGKYTPEEVDIPTRLEPFLPEYVPAIGVPFDGIQIPRPDGKLDHTGLRMVREPGIQSNVAQLELELRAASTSRRRQLSSAANYVHSIEDAIRHPQEIDRWIATVAKVQTTKPAHQVVYTKPMPSLNELMEIWPEAFEQMIAKVLPSLQLDNMDLPLVDAAKVVCGVLDIPVYEGRVLHAVHLLFTLYHEIVMYELEMMPPEGHEPAFCSS